MPTARILERTRFFRELGLWPHVDDFQIEAWLDNFAQAEQAVAERLLLAFCYFNERMTNALFRTSLENQLVVANKYIVDVGFAASIRVGDIAFVMCEGEDPHPTDSGNLFSRKLRDNIRVPESRIMVPGQALRMADDVQYFLFVDDFVGSGNQFIETMNRVHRGVMCSSFAQLEQQRPGCVGYSPCIATTKSIRRIAEVFPRVSLTPAHVLREEHSALHQSGPIWEGMNGSEAIQIIRQASLRAGYAATDGGQNDWRGFHRLALSVAFHHGIPDACLPIYFSSRQGWSPLIARPDHNGY